MGFSLRKSLRKLDITRTRNPLRAVAAIVPGGSALLTAADTAAGVKRAVTNRSGGRGGGASPGVASEAPPAPSLTSAARPGSTWGKLASSPMVILGAGVAVLVLVFFLFRRK